MMKIRLNKKAPWDSVKTKEGVILDKFIWLDVESKESITVNNNYLEVYSAPPEKRYKSMLKKELVELLLEMDDTLSKSEVSKMKKDEIINLLEKT